MLNPVLRSKLSPEFRLLYDSRMRLTEATIKSLMATYVKNIRKGVKKAGEDKLETKYKTFKDQGSWYRARVQELVKALYNIKSVPNDFLGHWRSIEFELVFKSLSARDEFANAVRCSALKSYVTIKNDMSIKRNENDGVGVPHEVVLSYKSGNEQAVYDFCRFLKGRAYVNKSCGTHFHIDMRHVNEEDAKKYGKRLARCVPALKTMLPLSRRTSSFCKETINEIGTDPGSTRRYAFVNLSAYRKYKSIEVRGHSGTINADKILNWIKLCEKIMATDVEFLPVNTGDVTSVDELIKQYNLEDGLAKYVKERYQQFNNSAAEEGEEKPVEVEVNAPAALNIPAPRPITNIQPTTTIVF